MALIQVRSLLSGLVLLVAAFGVANGKASETDPVVCETLSRENFDALDPEFIFGSASASYQFEGAVSDDGRTPSIWDHYTHTYPERIADGSNGDVTTNQYNRYPDDVQIMKDMGFEAYRLSISWTRVLPTGKLSGGVNQLGIQYYNNVINELLNNSIVPYVTIFHWDIPQSLEEEFGGFRSPRVVDYFKDYAELLFTTFGDRVKHWITLNEPYTFSNKGYAIGTFPPGRCSAWQTDLNCLGGDSGTEPYVVGHHFLLCHAAAVELYKTKYQEFQKGVIGITLVSVWVEPLSESLEDQAAANRSMDFIYGWYMDPIVHGDYPQSMRNYVGQRLPYFTEKESQLLKGSYDFIGINYYTARYAANDNTTYDHGSYVTDPHAIISTERDGVPLCQIVGSDWLCVYPEGIEKILLYTKEKYNDPIIYITENGASEWEDPSLPLEQALNDTARIDYYSGHLCYVESAMKNGVRLKGYFAWSLLDNFEWEDGYTVRFGIVYVDYDDEQTRYYKASTYWWQNFLSNNVSSIKGIRKFGGNNNRDRIRKFGGHNGDTGAVYRI